jgi:hypothetical protein
MFISYFKIVFTLKSLKMVLSFVRFSPGFLLGEGFSREHVFCGFSGAPSVISTTLGAASLNLSSSSGVLEARWSKFLSWKSYS